MKQNKNYNDEKIKSLLKQMPQVEDHQDADDLFHKISLQLSNEKSVKKERRIGWIIPSMATAVAAIIFMFIVGPFSSPNDNYELMSDSALDTGQPESMSGLTSEEAELLPPENTEEHGIATVEESSMHSSRAVYKENSQLDYFTLYVTDKSNIEYLIPLAFPYSNPDDIEHILNNVHDYIHPEHWGIDATLYDNISFSLLPDHKQVVVTVGDTFIEVAGSSRESALIDALHNTFRPLGYETIDFNQTNNTKVNFSHIGSVDIDPIPATGSNYSYKLYQKNEETPIWLVPVPVEETNVEEAIWNLQVLQDNEQLLRPSIPKEVVIEDIQTIGNEGVHITFAESTNVYNSQELTYMIDAILMTIKSYGYQYVQFLNGDDAQIGPYHLLEKIKVPDTVNDITYVN
ncbi:hypothetical protein HNQ94_003777 [Salirhabdus euzebyi]|uniref:Negative regulator of sigma-X activity n=1 Tax=Salirhabdus euzebyi TaxID=394506 RepID=A0A841QAM6_9BACI|nr:hypothetical protein [Salirhabdus euzebyi]MBB6455277.1 hypothetical protein [Salirhabdus euzebyi]